jgi:HPt (histidine-containing phosphotransfer) domain-containing protein
MEISVSEMPVVLITAASSNEEWQKYRDEGFDGILLKPFTEELLLSSILEVKSYKIRTEYIDSGHPDTKPGNDGKLDLHNLYHLSGRAEKFVKQMLISFIETTEKGLNDLKEAVIKQQWGSAADISHKIEPPCRHTGAMELYKLLYKIERTIRNNENTDSVESLADNAIAEFGIVSRLINDHIAKMS